MAIVGLLGLGFGLLAQSGLGFQISGPTTHTHIPHISIDTNFVKYDKHIVSHKFITQIASAMC